MSTRNLQRLLTIESVRWTLTAIIAGLVAVAWTWLKWPVPAIHDEFSYLLGADTLAHGRLSNPTHPFWQHFETFHVICTPTYVSKYPVGSFLFLALGKLFGEPVVGIWIGFICAVLAVVWAARGLVAWRWAIVSGGLLMVNPVLHSCWTQSFLSGWPAVAFSAVYFGAILRLRRGWRASTCIVAVLGLIGMGMTRPWEGLLTGIVGCVLFIALWVERAGQIPIPSLRCCLTGGTTLMIGALVWAQYNSATTGSWRTMAYQVHEREYGMAPVLLFVPEPKQQPEYRHGEFLRFHRDWSLPIYLRQRTLPGFVAESFHRSGDMLVFWGLTLGLIPAWTVFHWSKWRIGRNLGIAFIVLLLSTCMVPWLMPHYMACMLPIPVIFATLGIQQLSKLWQQRSRRIGLILCFLVAVNLPALIANTLADARSKDLSNWAQQRQAIQRRLAIDKPNDLVLVHYEPDHNPHHEWVYNDADLDKSPVVWAREIDNEHDLRLIEYFSDRRIWRLYADEANWRLELIRQAMDPDLPSP